MTMPLWQGIATVAAVVLGTLVTRFLPFLLFPAGKLRGIGIRLFGEPDHLQKLSGARFGLRLRNAFDLDGRIGDVAQTGHVRKKVKMLKHHAGVLADSVDLLVGGVLRRTGSAGMRHDFAVDNDFPAGDLFKMVDTAQERALAGAGRPDDGNRFAF